MQTTTRRKILAGAAALPLLPVTALAASVTLPLLPVSAFAKPAVDPVIPAYRAWCESLTAFENVFTERPDDESAHKVAHVREFASRLALSDIVATTPAGLALQIRFAFSVFGEVDGPDGDWFNLDDYHFRGWAEDHEGRLLRSMLTGAEHMAGVSS